MTRDWLLLIYTLPSQPTRKRAYVWRELKKVGAVYLRDGVVLLPRLPALEQRLRDIVERIAAYDGTADLALSPVFAAGRDEELVQRFQEERTPEYRQLHHAGVRFLRDVLEEVDADDFGFPDVDNLESELGRLRRWQTQVEARDYFGAPGSERVREVLEKCERAFERFASVASERGGAAPRLQPEDVFERLGGEAPAHDAPRSDLPF